MPLRNRVDLLCSLRLWKFCRKQRIALLKTYSSKGHWICLPLYFCGIPLSRARCITDPIGSKGRAFVFRHGCSQSVAEPSVINVDLCQTDAVDRAKIQALGTAAGLDQLTPPRDRMKFRRESR